MNRGGYAVAALQYLGSAGKIDEVFYVRPGEIVDRLVIIAAAIHSRRFAVQNVCYFPLDGGKVLRFVQQT